jgi:probable rRNA maturation factor
MRVPRRKIAGLIEHIARAEGVGVAEVDVAVVDAETIAELNARHLRHAGATDVLSFDLSDASQAGLSVQLIVCGDVAARVGPLHGLSATRELLLYVAHGLLHQMGYDDQAPRAAATMRARQEELLDAFLSSR